MKYVEIGKESGGKVIMNENGSAKSNTEDLTVHPVIFTDQPKDSKIIGEEILGLVAVINTLKTEEEVIAKANDTEFGLYAAFYTEDLERVLRVSKKLESGMIGVNCASLRGS